MNTNTIAWQDESELAMVRDWFYPGQKSTDPYQSAENEDMRNEAVARVNVWTFKTHKVPAAVIATADLTDSILQYEHMERAQNAESYRAVQFMFAFAFLRFVNGFVDRDVAKDAVASLVASENDDDEDRVPKTAGESSMYAHAAAISMPSRFVDLRHKVNHGVVPDVQILKQAADEALVWLWHKWWKNNAIGDSGIAWARFEAKGAARGRASKRDQEDVTMISGSGG